MFKIRWETVKKGANSNLICEHIESRSTNADKHNYCKRLHNVFRHMCAVCTGRCERVDMRLTVQQSYNNYLVRFPNCDLALVCV